MPEKTHPWGQALDQPGSADSGVMRLSTLLALAIVLVGCLVVIFGEVRLAVFPQFSIFHASFVFLVGGITAFVLLGQFRYRRRLTYAVLATAYLFAALLMVPFLLTFPGALKENIPVFGGIQSSASVWITWHLVFPIIVSVSVLVHRQDNGHQVDAQHVRTISVAATGTALLLASIVALLVTRFHDALPVLIDLNRPTPVTPTFYAAGVTMTALTALAALLCWHEAKRQRTILHFWLAVTLLAYLADSAASLSTTMRFTVGWYFGRVAGMVAASVLLLLFLNRVNTLYLRLASTMNDLLASNERLGSLLQEKEELVASLRDSEEQVRQLAYYDTLTDLPNRRLLLDRLDQALNQARRHRCSMAILFMDLDNFKQINDTLGHDAGDKLLVQVAGRIKICLRKGDTASRSGGDEFIVVLPEIAHPQDAALVAEKILVALRDPVKLGEHHTKASISIGIAIYPIDGEDDMRDLLRKADKAMYAAKADGRNLFRFYCRALDPEEPDSPDL